MAQKLIGIDFGTSNTSIAYVSKSRDVCLVKNKVKPGGGFIFESSILTEGNLGGGDAHLLRAFISEKSAELFSRYEYFPWNYSKNEAGIYRFDLKPVHELCADFIRQLCGSAREEVLEDITGCVFSIPHFDHDSIRETLHTLGSEAGLNEIHFRSDLAAAVKVILREEPSNGPVVVYDMGGGKFSAAVAELKENRIEMLAETGDWTINGNRMNMEIARAVIEHDAEEGGELRDVLLARKDSLRQFWEAIEKAKCALSHRHSVDLSILDGQAKKIFEKNYSSYEMKSACESVILESVQLTASVMKQAGVLGDSNIKIVTIGKASRMPLIQNALAETFGSERVVNRSADHLVALGLGQTLLEDYES